MNTCESQLAWIEEGKWLVLDDGTAAHYDINLDQFSTGESTRRWLLHLEEKRWFTPTHREQVLELLEGVKAMRANDRA